MPLIVNHTELDVPQIIADLRALVDKSVKRENLETLSELHDQIEELYAEAEAFSTKLEELEGTISSLADQYETWADDENDRDTRMTARDDIEAFSGDVGTLLDELEMFIE